MSFKKIHRALGLAIALLFTAPQGRALEVDYFVHFTATNMQPGYITSGYFDGTPLVPPAGAFGMRFESVDGKEWVLAFYTEDADIPPGTVDAWLGFPSSGVTFEPLNSGGGPDFIGPPGGLEGALRLVSAKGYWVDGNHNKLIYKNSCGSSCDSPPASIYGGSSFDGQVRITGWISVPDQLEELRYVLGGGKGVRSAEVLFPLLEKNLPKLSDDISGAISRRRSYVGGSLEKSVLAIEEDARKRLSTAVSQFRDCRSSQVRGDLKSAVSSCSAALRSVTLARAGLETAERWMH